MELCCGGLVVMGKSVERRAELATQLAELEPHEVPLNFLSPRPGTLFGNIEPMESDDALRTIAAFRLALPSAILRYAGGRKLTLGGLGTRDGLLGGINAVIVGNYLTTLGRDPNATPRRTSRCSPSSTGPSRPSTPHCESGCSDRGMTGPTSTCTVVCCGGVST